MSSRLTIAAIFAFALVIDPSALHAAARPAEKIRASVEFVLPKQDKIVVMYREKESDHYRHIKPEEFKVKLIIDGKEAKIDDFKVKDTVEFTFIREENRVLEVKLIKRGK